MGDGYGACRGIDGFDDARSVTSGGCALCARGIAFHALHVRAIHAAGLGQSRHCKQRKNKGKNRDPHTEVSSRANRAIRGRWTAVKAAGSPGKRCRIFLFLGEAALRLSNLAMPLGYRPVTLPLAVAHGKVPHGCGPAAIKPHEHGIKMNRSIADASSGRTLTISSTPRATGRERSLTSADSPYGLITGNMRGVFFVILVLSQPFDREYSQKNYNALALRQECCPEAHRTSLITCDLRIRPLSGGSRAWCSLISVNRSFKRPCLIIPSSMPHPSG